MLTLYKPILFLGLAGFLTTVVPSPVAKAEAPTSWRVVSPEVRYSHRVPDGRTFQYGYANIQNVRDGRWGVLFSLYKPNAPVSRFAVPADHVSELNPVNTKAWWNIPDWLKKLVNGVKNIVKGVQGISDALKQIAQGIAEVMDGLGLDTADGINTSVGGGNTGKLATTKYLLSINDARSLPFDVSLAERLAYSHWQTVQSLPASQRPAVWYQFALSVIKKESN